MRRSDSIRSIGKVTTMSTDTITAERFRNEAARQGKPLSDYLRELSESLPKQGVLSPIVAPVKSESNDAVRQSIDEIKNMVTGALAVTLALPVMGYDDATGGDEKVRQRVNDIQETLLSIINGAYPSAVSMARKLREVVRQGKLDIDSEVQHEA